MGVSSPAPAEGPRMATGQQKMSLSERMFIRREVVFEAVRDVMHSHGWLPSTYRVSVSRRDARGHAFVVMVDLLTPSSDSAAEFQLLETRIRQVATGRFKVKVMGVYWRGALVAPTPERRVSSTDTRDPVVAVERRRSADALASVRTSETASDDGFPDTLADEAGRTYITPEELAAFEQALLMGQPSQGVQVGRRTYQTDLAPLE